jgi:hypothetical protein
MLMIVLDGTVVNVAIGSGGPAAAALTSGYRLAFWIGTTLVAAAIVVAVTVLRAGCQAMETPDAYNPCGREDRNAA